MELKDIVILAALLASVVVNVYFAYHWWQVWRTKLEVAIYRQQRVDALGLIPYIEDSGTENEDLPKITRIVVPSERDKEQVLKLSRYFHDLNIDTDLVIVNNFAHVYMAPELVQVES